MRVKAIIIILCLICSFAYSHAPAYAVDNRLVIAPRNFGFDTADTNKRDASMGTWNSTDTTGFFGNILSHGVSTNAVPATMRFYMNEDGLYRIYARVKDRNDSTARRSYIQVDDLPKINFCTDKSQAGSSLTWYWDNGPHAEEPVLSLTKGFHSFKVGTDVGYARIDTIIIQKDGAPFNTNITAGELTALLDITSPVFESGTVNTIPGDTSITITQWPDASDDTGIVAYTVLKKNIEGVFVQIGAIASGEPKIFTDSALDEGTSYEYSLRAYDKMGQYDEITFTGVTTGVIDNEPPYWDGTPVITAGNIGYSGAELSWPAAVDNRGVAGYNIYISSVAEENLLETVTNTFYTLTGLPSGAAAEIFVEAFDSRGNKSTAIKTSVLTLASVNYLFKHDNFAIPEGATWIAGESDGANLLPVGRVFSNSAGGAAPIEALIYIPSNGKYVLWLNVRDYASSNPGSRYVTVAVDEVYDEYRYGAATPPVDGWGWYKGREWSLTKGWHKVSVRGAAFARFAALYVTNDTSKTLLNSADYYVSNLKKYESTPPSLDGAVLNALTSDETSLALEWSFSDPSVMGYRITVDDVDKGLIEKNEYRIDHVYGLKNIAFKVEGLNPYGAGAALTKNTTVSRLDAGVWEIRNQAGVKAQSKADLGGSCTGVIKAKNVSGTSLTAVLRLGIFNETTGVLISGEEKEIAMSAGDTIEQSIGVSLPGSGFNLILSIWEKETNKPLQKGIKL